MPSAVPPESPDPVPVESSVLPASPSRASTTAPRREIELKLLLDPAHVEAVKNSPLLRRRAVGDMHERRLRSTYYDTADLRILGAGYALRVRDVGRRRIQTLKSRAIGGSGSELFARTEIEVAVPAGRPDLAAIPDEELRELLLEKVGQRPLEAVLETDVRRSSRRLAEGDTQLDADLDVGEIRTPAGSLAICELELELVEGNPAALYRVALELLESVPLRLAMESKFDRGLALLTGVQPKPQRAKRIDVEGDAPIETALERILAGGLQQVLANETPAYYGTDPEGVHQMRVGVRRLRSALSMFSTMLPPRAVELLRKELSWLASALGRARDLDVFTLEVLEPVASSGSQSEAFEELRVAAADLRKERYEDVRGALDSDRYTALMLSLGGWIDGRAWRDQPLSPESAQLFQPARQAARVVLRKRLRKVRKLARRLGDAPVERLHALRIALKKLRYAVEFLGSAFDAKAARGYASEAADLQDVLGRLNDASTARGLLDLLCERLGDRAGPAHQRAVGFVLGSLGREVSETAPAARARWKKLRRRRPFWK